MWSCHLTLICAALICRINVAQNPQISTPSANENVLRELVRVGQGSGVALGIIQLDNDALCQTASGDVPDHPLDVHAALNGIARQAGYEVIGSEGALLVRPYFVPGALIHAMEYQFPEFPELKDTMQGMGMVL